MEVDRNGVFMGRINPPNKRKQSIQQRLNHATDHYNNLLEELTGLEQEFKEVRQEVNGIKKEMDLLQDRIVANDLDQFRV